MYTILIFIFFGLGVIIGSFLNVVILRYNTHKTFGGRSACMSCRQTLEWYELIPLFSFLGLKGRCRTCKTKISIQYPAVELATGIIFALIYYKFANLLFLNNLAFPISFGYFAVVFSLLLVIAVYDLKHKIIPDLLVLIFGILSFLSLFLFKDYIYYPHFPAILELFSGLILALPFALLWFVSAGKWMGFGDAKLAVGMGYLVGLGGGFSSIMIASVLGSVVGVYLMLTSKKYGMKTELPFAPFLVLGVFIVFMYECNFFSLAF